MPWIIDTDILIEAERGNAAFLSWLRDADAIATADVIRGEFLLGVHAVADEAMRQRGFKFYSDGIARLPSFPSEPADYAGDVGETAGRRLAQRRRGAEKRGHQGGFQSGRKTS